MHERKKNRESILERERERESVSEREKGCLRERERECSDVEIDRVCV